MVRVDRMEEDRQSRRTGSSLRTPGSEPQGTWGGFGVGFRGLGIPGGVGSINSENLSLFDPSPTGSLLGS